MIQIISGRVPPHQSAFYRQILNGNHRTQVIKQTVIEVTQETPKHS